MRPHWALKKVRCTLLTFNCTSILGDCRPRSHRRNIVSHKKDPDLEIGPGLWLLAVQPCLLRPTIILWLGGGTHMQS